ncbi:MAG: winged helix-turn-helix domain-containing protein [Steroidobacteraceae bacterium]
MSNPGSPFVYEFGEFRLEPKRRLLARVGGNALPLSDKAFDALTYLVEHAGRVVTKDELMQALWPTTVVEENSLYVAISALRRALKDESPAQRIIATVAGRGYQFVAEVRVASSDRKRGPGRRAAAVLAIAAGLAVAAVATFLALRNEDGAEPAGVAMNLAVLPFRPLTLEDRNESLELGMTETLIAGLNAGNLSVSPLSSVRRFAGMEQDVLAAGRALGVQAVLEGHLQRSGDQLRVSARLIDVESGRQLWAERYDERFTDIFSVQDSIAEKVRAALTVELAGEAPPVPRRYTDDAEAYQQYANGRFHHERFALPRALQHYEQAIALDPGFALAYVGLADARAAIGVFGMVAPRDTFPQATAAAHRAMELAPDLGEAYASLGHIKVQYEHDWSGAERAYQRAIELNPNHSWTRAYYGIYLATCGRFDEGILQLRHAQALEPAQAGFSALIGMLLVYQRRYAAAIGQLESTLETDPAFPTTNTYLAFAHLRRGDYDKAASYLARVKAPAPGSGAYRGQLLALSGRPDEALQELDGLLAMSRQRYVPAYDIATIYAALGMKDETFEWLARAFEDRSQLIAWLAWDALFDGIRDDPRYAPLFERLPAAGISSPE